MVEYKSPYVEFVDGSQVVDVLEKIKNSFKRARIAVAFMSYGGLKLLESPLYLKTPKEFKKRKKRIELLVSLAQPCITDPKALDKILKFKKKLGKYGKNLQVRYYAKEGGLHSKLFLFEGQGENVAIIGSSNATEGGFKKNKEANLLIRGNPKTSPFPQIEEFFDNLWKIRGKIGPVELTESILKDYESKRNSFRKAEENAKKESRKFKIPTGKFGTKKIRKKGPYLYIDDTRYSVSDLYGYCTLCNRQIPIPPNWVRGWICDKHVGVRCILTKKRGYQPQIAIGSVSNIKSPRKIEGECRRRKKREGYCDRKFSLSEQFTHMICNKCYTTRNKEQRYKYRGFYYDKDKVFK